MPHLSRAARGAALSWARDVNAARKIPSIYVSLASEGRTAGGSLLFFREARRLPQASDAHPRRAAPPKRTTGREQLHSGEQVDGTVAEGPAGASQHLLS